MARDGPDSIDMLRSLPSFVMVPRDRLEAVVREVRETAEAAELRRVEKKVNEWIKAVSITDIYSCSLAGVNCVDACN